MKNVIITIAAPINNPIVIFPNIAHIRSSPIAALEIVEPEQAKGAE